MLPVRVRFAPSPTGPLHIGGARSALFNWLFARHSGGAFIVRIEDTDRERSSLESEENILAALKWLGLDWDEGIGTGGPNGPYRQTGRLELYRRFAVKLLAGGHAYRCFCTEEELAAERDSLMERGEMPRYLGRCRSLTGADCDRLEQEGRRSVVRFRVPEDQVIHLRDMVRGDVSFECSGIGDFIIVKSDGIPTYNFAVVVDDYTMAISHVIRAEEHLSNTPRQVLIYRALGWAEPEFAHVSLILGNDRSKMSKRHGATSIEQYRDQGYLPEALVNFLALLGWSPGGEEEIFSLEELKDQFSLDRVAKSPAVFDLDKLNWLNGHYIRQAPLERIIDLALPYLDKAGYIKLALLNANIQIENDLSNSEFLILENIINVIKNYLEKYTNKNNNLPTSDNEILNAIFSIVSTGELFSKYTGAEKFEWIASFFYITIQLLVSPSQMNEKFLSKCAKLFDGVFSACLMLLGDNSKQKEYKYEWFSGYINVSLQYLCNDQLKSTSNKLWEVETIYLLTKKYVWLKKVVASVRKYLTCLDQIPAHASIYFAAAVAPEDEEAASLLAEEQAPAVLAALKDKLLRSGDGDEITEIRAKALLKEVAKELKLNGKKVFMPVRVALSGKAHGPDLDQIMAILGRDRVAGRLSRALVNMPR